MSLLINNDLIWISIPKCASMSIERELLESNLNIKIYSEYKYGLIKKKRHGHILKSALFNEFGTHPTVCITRNWLDKWVSSLEFVWQRLTMNNYSPIIQWEDIDNQFIYNTFDTNFVKNLYYTDDWSDNLKKLINNPLQLETDNNSQHINSLLATMVSQNYWKENQPCTYEFDIKEIHKFEEFIQKRYGVSFKIPHLNSTPKIKNKIEINDELKNHLWNIFEKPFEKRNALI
jgi:hypothetical protein